MKAAISRSLALALVLVLAMPVIGQSSEPALGVPEKNAPRDAAWAYVQTVQAAPGDYVLGGTSGSVVDVDHGNIAIAGPAYRANGLLNVEGQLWQPEGDYWAPLPGNTPQLSVPEGGLGKIAVAGWGDCIMIGITSGPGEGLARIYHYDRDMADYKVIAEFEAPEGVVDFGQAVVFDDHGAAVGARDAVYVYDFEKDAEGEEKWSFMEVLKGPAGSGFGRDVDQANGILAIGAPSESTVHIYEKTPGKMIKRLAFGDDIVAELGTRMVVGTDFVAASGVVHFEGERRANTRMFTPQDDGTWNLQYTWGVGAVQGGMPAVVAAEYGLNVMPTQSPFTLYTDDPGTNAPTAETPIRLWKDNVLDQIEVGPRFGYDASTMWGVLAVAESPDKVHIFHRTYSDAPGGKPMPTGDPVDVGMEPELDCLPFEQPFFEDFMDDMGRMESEPRAMYANWTEPEPYGDDAVPSYDERGLVMDAPIMTRVANDSDLPFTQPTACMSGIYTCQDDALVDDEAACMPFELDPMPMEFPPMPVIDPLMAFIESVDPADLPQLAIVDVPAESIATITPSPKVQIAYEAKRPLQIVERIEVTPDAPIGIPNVPGEEIIPDMTEYLDIDVEAVIDMDALEGLELDPTRPVVDQLPEGEIDRVTIEISYDEADLPPGFDEDDLGLHFFDGEDWVDLRNVGPDATVPATTEEGALHVFEAGVDKERNTVYAVVDHTSTYALGISSGEPLTAAPVKVYETPWLWIGVLAVLAAAVWGANAAITVYRRSSKDDAEQQWTDASNGLDDSVEEAPGIVVEAPGVSIGPN